MRESVLIIRLLPLLVAAFLFSGGCSALGFKLSDSEVKYLYNDFPHHWALANTKVLGSSRRAPLKIKDGEPATYEAALRERVPEKAKELLCAIKRFDQPILFRVGDGNFHVCMRMASREYTLCDDAFTTGVDIKCERNQCTGPGTGVRGDDLNRLMEILRAPRGGK